MISSLIKACLMPSMPKNDRKKILHAFYIFDPMESPSLAFPILLIYGSAEKTKVFFFIL